MLQMLDTIFLSSFNPQVIKNDSNFPCWCFSHGNIIRDAHKKGNVVITQKENTPKQKDKMKLLYQRTPQEES